jgi:phospholipase C
MGQRPTFRNRLRQFRLPIAIGTAAVLAAGAAVGATAAHASNGTPSLDSQLAAEFPGYHVPATASKTLYDHSSRTATPIKHVVVLFDENESFDHYFGTYPYAANTDGTPFTAKPGTQTVKGLYTKVTKNGPTGPLLTDNANEYNPERLSSTEAWTSDQNHGYTAEQSAYDNGKQDKYVQDTESSSSAGCGAQYCQPGVSMDYFDGNTVTALWNYAQNYSMSDNNYDDVYGPSTPGALSVTSGTTVDGYAADPYNSSTPGTVASDSGSVYNPNLTTDGTIYGDIDPYYDECSDSNHTSTSPTGISNSENIGDLLNSKHITWGWFQGGFAPSSTNSGGAVCGTSHSFTVTNSDGTGTETAADYVPHHDPFQFNASTANPAHLAPSSLSDIGYTDQANHQYDTSYFTDALNGTGGAQLPAVSYIKPPAYENAHPGNSDPLEEQQFLVNEINAIEKSKYWSSTAIVITYDDSDGWYDSATNPTINGSDTSLDTSANCAKVSDKVSKAEAACGLGDRLPMIVISPYTRDNYVSNNLTDTASVVKFIEQNWLGGETIPGSYDKVSGSLDAPGGLLDFNVRPHDTPVILNPTTGAVVSGDNWPGNEGKKVGARA